MAVKLKELKLYLEGTVETPKRLPIVEYQGKHYFYDERLKQIRNIRNPHDFFETEGRK